MHKNTNFSRNNTRKSQKSITFACFLYVTHYIIEEKMDKLSYALGLGIGRQLAQMGANNISIEDFADAIKDVVTGNDLKMTNQEAQTIVQDYFAKQEQRIQAEMAEKGKAAKEAGEKYLAENAKKADFSIRC